MHIKLSFFTKSYWPYISYLLLAAIVLLTKELERQYFVVAVIMLFLPMLDGRWKTPTAGIDKKDIFLWMVMTLLAMVVITFKPDMLLFFFSTLVFIAFPEEWFFRAYLMERIGNGLRANVIASICFAALHAITLNWVSSLLVFVPSLLFGWIYQKQRNIVSVALIHSVSNLIFTAFLYRYFEKLY